MLGAGEKAVAGVQRRADPRSSEAESSGEGDREDLETGIHSGAEMNKQRRKMSSEEIKEQEYQRNLRAQDIPYLKFEMMLKHSGGQCEEVSDSGRCPNKHGERGVTVAGIALLTPKFGKQAILQCQKCGFEDMREALGKPSGSPLEEEPQGRKQTLTRRF